MYDYLQLVRSISPISEDDLILFKASSDEKAHIVKQFNRALINAKGDGTDVAQIFLKPLITKYPTWGDAALVFGLCLAREYQFSRAAESFEFAINNVLGTENNLLIAQQALKWVREDAQKPIPKEANPNQMQDKGSMVSEMGSVSGRRGMQAPILMRASHGSSRPQMATDKERRDILMRAASSNGELPDDDIMVDIPSTPADRVRTTARILAVVVALIALVCLIYFVIVPTVVRVKASNSNEEKVQFLVDKLKENSTDPTVASILSEYATKYVDKTIPTESTTATSEEVVTTVEETTTEEVTTTTTTELVPSFANQDEDPTDDPEVTDDSVVTDTPDDATPETDTVEVA